MVFKFLSKGKKSEYFLEAPPATNGAEPIAKVANKVAEVANKVTDKAAEMAHQVVDQVTDKATEAAPAAKPEPTAKAVVKAEPKAKKIKKTKSADAKAATPSVDGQAVGDKSVAAKPASTPEPVKNFATDYLMPTNTPRRRPGPSLEMFKNMAKDVTPRR
jgi:hypothetical protein